MGEPTPNPEPASPAAVAALTAAGVETAAGLSFERDIKVLFRAFDRVSMLPFGIDLHDYASIREAAEYILGRLATGNMPCDGAWPRERVEIFRAWMAQGFPT